MTREQPLGFQPPSIGEEEIEAVAETLRSGWLTTGPRAALLEERMADYLEAKHVLAVASGTAAMHLALVALGIEAGDEVTIKAGDASITLRKDGTVAIKGKDIVIEGAGDATIKAGKNVTLKGSKVLGT